MMQVSVSPPRPRPSIAIHIQPNAHRNAHHFTLPRKRKRSVHYSSSDEESGASSAIATSTALHGLDGYSSSSPIKEHEGRLITRKGSGSGGYDERGVREGDLEGERRHHKRVKRTIAQMGGLSLHPTPPGTQQIQQSSYEDRDGYGHAPSSSFSGDSYGQPQLVSPMSNASGTSYGSIRGETGAGYHGVDGPELLEFDEAFMPREHGHGHDHEHDAWDSYRHTFVPEIEDLPLPPRSSTSHTTTATSNDIKMGGTGWYEPEKDRIVITDLDDSDLDTDANAPSPNAQDAEIMDDDERPFHTFKVSSAYLQRFGKPANAPEIPPAPSIIIENAGSECQALVLYRPSFPIYKHVSVEPSIDAQKAVMADITTMNAETTGSGDAMELDD